MSCGMDGKPGNQNVEMNQTQKHSGCFGENHCLTSSSAEIKTELLGFESFFTSKSSLQDGFHNPFQLWLVSVLNKQLSSLGIFQFPVGWQRKDMQHRGLKEIICLTFAGWYGCISLKAAAFSHPRSQYRLVYQAEAAGLTDTNCLVLSA